MTKTIEEVKAAKRELELKISQMVNEFELENDVLITNIVVSHSLVMMPNKVFADLAYCEIEIKF